MPGIAGIIGEGPIDEIKAALASMMASMAHERFYSAGTLVREDPAVGVGWVCHKGSFSDCLPIWNKAGDICLVFAGEHYGDRVNAEQLRVEGRQRSNETASYLMNLYEEHGMEFFRRLNGIFSGLIVNLRDRKIVLFNDRYGLGRVYYHESAGRFYFASEAKALLKVLPPLRRLDMQSWGEFFSCGCALQNRTLFSGVSLLPGGAIWTFRTQPEVRREFYFHRDVWENQETLSPASYYEKLKETFARVLPRYFQGKESVALSLTGGIDSRMIIAGAQFLPFRLQCYTFGGMYRDCADVRIARRVAKACQQYHEVVALHRKFFFEFPALAKRSVYFTDGAMDVTGAVGLFVNRMAREIAPVRLTGNYGSEILRGHIAFKTVPPCLSMFDRQFLPSVHDAVATYSAERRGHCTSFIVFKQVPWHHYAVLALEGSQVTVRSPYLDNDLVSLAFQAPADPATNKEMIRRFIAESSPTLAGIPTDRGAVERPMLVPRGIWDWWKEFFPRAEYVYDYGMPQWLAKVDRVLAPLHLEKLFLGRQKFAHFRLWYRDELAAHVKEVLLDPATLSRPYLNGRRVEQMVTAHLAGRGNYTREIHKLLTSELIQRQLIEMQ